MYPACHDEKEVFYSPNQMYTSFFCGDGLLGMLQYESICQKIACKIVKLPIAAM